MPLLRILAAVWPSLLLAACFGGGGLEYDGELLRCPAPGGVPRVATIGISFGGGGAGTVRSRVAIRAPGDTGEAQAYVADYHVLPEQLRWAGPDTLIVTNWVDTRLDTPDPDERGLAAAGVTVRFEDRSLPPGGWAAVPSRSRSSCR